MRTWNQLSVATPLPNSTRMVGFVPYEIDIVVTGTVEKAVMKSATKGFFILKIEEPVRVSSREANDEVEAPAGSLVGLRYCHSLRSLGNQVGQTVRCRFSGTEQRDNYVYHRWDVKVAVDTDEREVA